MIDRLIIAVCVLLFPLSLSVAMWAWASACVFILGAQWGLAVAGALPVGLFALALVVFVLWGGPPKPPRERVYWHGVEV